MTLQEKLLTVEEFWAQYAGQPYELIHGRVVPMHRGAEDMPPTGLMHMLVTAKVIGKLQQYVDENPVGVIGGGEGGFQLSEDTMRAADAAFISNEKLDQVVDLAKFAPFAPDLAVEVISPNEKAVEIQEKVNLYLETGSLLVWTIFPDLRVVVVHYPDGTTRRLKEGDTLDGGDVLPGLAIPVEALFPARRDG